MSNRIHLINPPPAQYLAVIKMILLLGLLYSQSTQASIDSFYDTVIHPDIPLLDENGDHVLNSGKAYSPKKSCEGSGCHDYEAITHAYHFEMGRDEASDDYGTKRGLPQLVSPGYFGGYTCMGGSRPNLLSKKNNASVAEFKDFGAAGLIQGCIGCHAGGGFMEKDRDGIRYDEKPVASIPPLDGDYYNRGTDPENPERHSLSNDIVARWDWKKSGVVEADCMMCHAKFDDLKKFPASNLGKNDLSDGSDSAYDFWRSLRGSTLVEHGLFSEAGTAMWEFLDIRPDEPNGLQVVSFERIIKEGKEGSTRGYDLVMGADGKPVMNWNKEAFDENGKIKIPMLRFPGNDNCMMCHVTSNSRRGFYGYGDNATIEFDDNGIIQEDYQDDVHKGKTWTAANGQTRKIENCNTCHSSNFFHSPFENVVLNANHNFLKGNSDMDVRNDLDFADNAKSCEFCHDESHDPVIPSGQETMLDAHRELWKANGDMTGYTKDSLTKITQTHLDVVSCQGCHITGKTYRGQPMQIMYRYREGADGKSKIFPYNPKIRFYWKDKNSDHVLSRHETDSVFEKRTGDDGKDYGAIVDPITGEELAKVTFSMGRHGPSFGAPESYEAFVALKEAYDKLLTKNGIAGTDMQQVYTESNEYIMSHNVRPSASSVPCGDCHNRKQNGAFSALVAADSILGETNVKTVATLPDRRLVDEGYIRLDLPYFKLNDDGKVTENVSDILYATKVNPFMTRAMASNATTIMGAFKQATISEILESIEMKNDALRQSIENAIGDQNGFFFNSAIHGDSELNKIALVALGGGIADVLFPLYRVEIDVYTSLPAQAVNAIESVVPGSKIASSVFQIEVQDNNKNVVDELVQTVYVKIPYKGKASTADRIKVITSVDGKTLNQVDDEMVVSINPHTDESDGYVIFATKQLAFVGVVDLP